MALTDSIKPSAAGGMIGGLFGGIPGALLGGTLGGNIKPLQTADRGISTAVNGAIDWFKKPGQEMQKAADLTQNQLGDLTSWYDSNYYQDYMNSAEARSSMSSLTEQVKKVLMGYNNQAVATGATPEAQLAAKTGAQSSMSDAINRLAGMGTQRKESTRRDYMNYSGLLNNQMANIYRDKAQGYQTQQNNLFSGIGDLFGALTSAGSMVAGMPV
jgi:hypothetical protein